MSKDEFKLLSPEDQMYFINNGGVIEVTSHEGAVTAVDSLGESGNINFERASQEMICERVKELTTPCKIVTNEILEEPLIKDVQGAKLHKQEGSFDTPSSPEGGSSFNVSLDSNLGIAIDSPLELLYILDEDVKSKKVTLYPWQIQFLTDFALGGMSDSRPFQALLRAANGSGKDKYIVAPCVVWLCMRYKKARGVITSSSGAQLDSQTCTYIDQLCKSANRVFQPFLGYDLWKINYRYFECFHGAPKIHEEDNSPITCFATDEPGKAEGYHPLAFGAKMVIMESEAKTVPDEIYTAQNRCTGYTHRCLVSSPGNTQGHFYNLSNISVDRKKINGIEELTASDYVEYHVTAYDCPSHLRLSYIEQLKRDTPGGENSAAFKSQVLAEFGSQDEMVVIPYTYVWRAINDRKRIWYPEDNNTGGLDLADGGVETALTVRNGNKHLKTVHFIMSETEDTLRYLAEQFKENGLDNPEALIFCDICGIGAPMMKILRSRGWTNLRFVDSRHKSRQPKTYANTGTELWFNVRKLFEDNCIILNSEIVLNNQLSTRYYKLVGGTVHQVLSKIEQRSKGYSSPDRADSFNLAFWNYKTPAGFIVDYSGLLNTTAKFGVEEKSEVSLKPLTLMAIANRGSEPQQKQIYGSSNQNNSSRIMKELERYNNRQIANKE